MGPSFISNTVSCLADKFNIELTYKKMAEDESELLGIKFADWQILPKGVKITLEND